jgi:hypothetical protein
MNVQKHPNTKVPITPSKIKKLNTLTPKKNKSTNPFNILPLEFLGSLIIILSSVLITSCLVSLLSSISSLVLLAK